MSRLDVEAEVACWSTSAEAYLLRPASQLPWHRILLQGAGQKHACTKSTMALASTVAPEGFPMHFRIQRLLGSWGCLTRFSSGQMESLQSYVVL